MLYEMTNQISQEELKEYVLHGLATDIFIAERAYELFVTIGKKGKQFDSKYQEFFKASQGAFKDQFLLSLARLFDRPSTRNKIRCVQGLLNHLVDNKNRLPMIVEKYNLAETMKYSNFNPVAVEIVLSDGPDAQITESIQQHFHRLLETQENLRLLDKLKVLRDKRLAHNELVSLTGNEMSEAIDNVTFQELYTLLAIPKELLGVVGWAYMSMVFVHDGVYHLSEDAKRASLKLTKLADDYFID
jgi:hypothetical protein